MRRRLTQLARTWALLALVASAAPVLAQEAPPAAGGAATRTVTPSERKTQRVERIRSERVRVLRQAPTGFEGWARGLPPLHRRQLDRRLRRMPEAQREHFFREWSRMSLHDRGELADRIANVAEARRHRELPARLRTPEMRERLERMSPEQRREFFARAQDWRELDASERRHMRARLGRFGALTPDAQQALVDEKFKHKSAEERAHILGDLRAASQQMREMRGARADAASAAQDSPSRAQTATAAPPPATESLPPD